MTQIQPIVWIVSSMVFLLGVIGFLSVLFDQTDNPQSGDLPDDDEVTLVEETQQ